MEYRHAMSLPYGVWFLADGSEVLFDREYSPMWRRTPNGSCKRMEYQRVKYVRQNFFHIGGIVGRRLAKMLIQIEIDFCDGFAVSVLLARINNRFPVRRELVRQTEINGSNVIRLFPKQDGER